MLLRNISVFILGLTLATVASAQVSLPGQTTGAGTVITGSYSNSAGSRSYTAFIPTNRPAHPGLMVVLHGCLMTDQQMESGTNMDQVAGERGFIVLYPKQEYADNVMACWNWFKTENLQRAQGEGSIIIGMVQDLVNKYSIDDTRMAVAGLSAGAAMASNLLGCYSDLFQGGLIQSGFEYGAAQSESEAHSVMSNGSTRDLDGLAQQAYACSPRRSTLIPVIVVQGSSDPYVNPVNADRVASFFEKLNTLIARGVGQNPQVAEATKQLASVNGGYNSAETDSLFDGQVIVQKVIVQGMGHGWSGGTANQQYMDPKGPSSTEMIADLFFPKQ